MRKNVASQCVSAQLVSKLDGSNVTSGTTTVYVTVDGGTQASSGTATHEGQGQWSYLPTQAETNGNQVAFTFVNSSAVSATVNVWPVSYDPTDSVRLGLTALPSVATGNAGAIPTVGTGTGQISLSSGAVLLQATQTGVTIPTVTSVTGAVGSVTGNVGGNVTGSVGSLATQAKADVNAEVVDALATDTYAEPSSAPAATSSLKDKINWLFALARNKRTQTSSTQTLRNDADNASIATASVADDGITATRGEWS